MKKIVSKVILSAVLILGFSRKTFGESISNVGTEPLGGIVAPKSSIINMYDRILHLFFLPLGVLAVIFYSIYFLLKRKKKSKKRYLYIANITLFFTIIILIAWVIFDFIGETNHFGIFN